MTQGIYAITHKPSGRVYVGAAKNVEKRYVMHLERLARGKHHNKVLQAFYNAGGAECLHLDCLEIVVDAADLAAREAAHIEVYENPMNSRRAGRYAPERGNMISPEIRQAFKEAIKEAGVTQEELARRLGIAPQNLNRTLNSKAPQSKNWSQIFEILGVKLVLIPAVKDDGGSK